MTKGRSSASCSATSSKVSAAIMIRLFAPRCVSPAWRAIMGAGGIARDADGVSRTLPDLYLSLFTKAESPARDHPISPSIHRRPRPRPGRSGSHRRLFIHARRQDGGDEPEPHLCRGEG